MASSRRAATPRFILLAAVVATFFVRGEASSPPLPGVAPTLLISFDGFRASYLDEQPPWDLPNLNALWREGVRASLVPRFVSKTFPNHYSLITGLDEQTHGIVGNNMWDPTTNRTFTLASKDPEWWNDGEPMWVTARRDGRASRVFFWPGSEVEIRGVRPTEWRPYDGSVPYDDRVDAVARWMVSAAADPKAHTRPDFHALYLEEPDASGHAHGPASEATAAAVRRVDAALGRLRARAGDAVWAATNVVLVSDHGMAATSSERVVYLADEPCAVNFSEVAVSGGGVVMGVWPRGRDAEGRATRATRADWFDPAAYAARLNACHPNITAWAKADIPPRLRFRENARVAPVVIAADVGWVLCGRERETSDESDESDAMDWSTNHSACGEKMGTYRGTHGYDNDAAEMRAVFAARGPAFRRDGARLVGSLGVDADAVAGDDAAAEPRDLGDLAFDNTVVFSIVARALGIELDPGSNLADGASPPNVDGVLRPELAALVFSPEANAASGADAARRARRRGATRVFGHVVAVVIAAMVGASTCGVCRARVREAKARAYANVGDEEEELPEIFVDEPGRDAARTGIEMGTRAGTGTGSESGTDVIPNVTGTGIETGTDVRPNVGATRSTEGPFPANREGFETIPLTSEPESWTPAAPSAHVPRIPPPLSPLPPER